MYVPHHAVEIYTCWYNAKTVLCGCSMIHLVSTKLLRDEFCWSVSVFGHHIANKLLWFIMHKIKPLLKILDIVTHKQYSKSAIGTLQYWTVLYLDK